MAYVLILIVVVNNNINMITDFATRRKCDFIRLGWTDG